MIAGETLGSVRGSSEYLEAGHHHDVEVQLDEPVTESQTLIPMAHRDTNDNQAYDFVEAEGADDGPYATGEGDPVLDDAALTVEEDADDDAEDAGENVADDYGGCRTVTAQASVRWPRSSPSSAASSWRDGSSNVRTTTVSRP